MGRHTNLQMKGSETQENPNERLDSDSNEIQDNEYNEYDDRWDYLYDDISWQNERTKIRKSEKKEDKQRNKYNTRL